MRVGKAEVGRGGEEGGGVVLGRGGRGGVVLQSSWQHAYSLPPVCLTFCVSLPKCSYNVQ